MLTLKELTLVDSECKCEECTENCAWRPGWPSLEEAKKLVEAGYGKELMVDWWGGDSFTPDLSRIYLLCPAGKGHAGDDAAEGSLSDIFSVGRLPAMPCVMLTPEKLCKLHGSGMKPVECRCTSCNTPDPDYIHEAAAESWNSPRGAAFVLQWMYDVGYTGRFKTDLQEWYQRHTDELSKEVRAKNLDAAVAKLNKDYADILDPVAQTVRVIQLTSGHRPSEWQ
jgi:hypothetical protein